MNINNFEIHVDKKIIDRGYNYYKNGYIKEIILKNNNEYSFLIKGNYNNYIVNINIDQNGKILHTDCNCPYEYSLTCKHEVAAYYKLYEIRNSLSTNNNITIKKNTILETTLKSLSTEELINIIINETKKDLSLEDRIITLYTKGNLEQELAKCKNLINSIKRKYISTDEFIPYGEVKSFSKDMYDLIIKIKNTNDKLIALDISIFVLENFFEAFEYVDYSAEYIEKLIVDVIDEIKLIVINYKKSDLNIREEVLLKLLNYIDSKSFTFQKNFIIDILYICLNFCDNKAFRNKIIIKIESIISNNPDDYYENEMLSKIKLNILEQYGTKKESQQFIVDNIHFTSFRKLLIDTYLKEKQYEKVIQVSLEGEKKDISYSGLISQWKKYRYIAYKELSKYTEQEKLAKELLFDGNFEYYAELKRITKIDKIVFYNNLKKEIKEKKIKNDIYLKLIEQENDIDEIMDFVRKNSYLIEKYINKLKDNYYEESLVIYEKYIFNNSKLTNNRKEYTELCKSIKNFKRFSGKLKANEIIMKLKSTYPRRRALIEELNKI